MSSTVKISPSILSADFGKLGSEISELEKAGAALIHIDIMDGHYVPNITFGPNIVKSLRLITNKILDVHLMIKNVNDHIESFILAGSDIVSFHPEAVSNPEKIINTIKNFGKKCGIAIHPEVEIKEIEKYVALVDMVIVMTVIPGFGGQKFLTNQIPKISKLNQIKVNNNLNFEIEIDGGINNETSKICIENGATVLVAGSYIYEAPDSEYKNLINSLR